MGFLFKKKNIDVLNMDNQATEKHIKKLIETNAIYDLHEWLDNMVIKEQDANFAKYLMLDFPICLDKGFCNALTYAIFFGKNVLCHGIIKRLDISLYEIVSSPLSAIGRRDITIDSDYIKINLLRYCVGWLNINNYESLFTSIFDKVYSEPSILDTILNRRNTIYDNVRNDLNMYEKLYKTVFYMLNSMKNSYILNTIDNKYNDYYRLEELACHLLSLFGYDSSKIHNDTPHICFFNIEEDLNTNGDTYLHAAVKTGSKKLVSHIIDNFACAKILNYKDNKDKTPLYIAYELNNMGMAKYLESKGAKL